MAVEFAEVHGYPQENWTANTAIRKLVVAWDDRFDLIDELTNQQYPYKIDWNIIATRFTISPIMGKQDVVESTEAVLSNYELAYVTVEYGFPGHPEAEDVEGVLMLENFEPSLEFFTLDWMAYYWDVAGAITIKPAEAPAKRMPGGTLVTTRFDLASLPHTRVQLMGYTNNTSYTTKTPVMGNMVFPAGTLLYQPSNSDTIVKGSTTTLNYTERMTYRPTGWNKFWRSEYAGVGAPGIEEFVTMYKKTGPGAFVELKIFPEADFG